jgi:DNA-binding GntR family transcriptional regulator
MAHRLEVAVDNKAVMTEPSAYIRVYMAVLTVLEGRAGDEVPSLELPSQTTIALMANVSRETVSRAMKTLFSCGAVSKVGRRFCVVDRGLVEQLVKSS